MIYLQFYSLSFGKSVDAGKTPCFSIRPYSNKLKTNQKHAHFWN